MPQRAEGGGSSRRDADRPARTSGKRTAPPRTGRARREGRGSVPRVRCLGGGRLACGRPAASDRARNCTAEGCSHSPRTDQSTGRSEGPPERWTCGWPPLQSGGRAVCCAGTGCAGATTGRLPGLVRSTGNTVANHRRRGLNGAVSTGTRFQSTAYPKAGRFQIMSLIWNHPPPFQSTVHPKAGRIVRTKLWQVVEVG